MPTKVRSDTKGFQAAGFHKFIYILYRKYLLLVVSNCQAYLAGRDYRLDQLQLYQPILAGGSYDGHEAFRTASNTPTSVIAYTSALGPRSSLKLLMKGTTCRSDTNAPLTMIPIKSEEADAVKRPPSFQ